MLAFYEKPYWRKEGVPLAEQVTVALEPHAFNPDHPLYIDSVFDVSPPGGAGVLASFLWVHLRHMGASCWRPAEAPQPLSFECAPLLLRCARDSETATAAGGTTRRLSS